MFNSSCVIYVNINGAFVSLAGISQLINQAFISSTYNYMCTTKSFWCLYTVFAKLNFI